MSIESEGDTYYAVCNNCGDSYLGERMPGEWKTPTEALRYVRTLGWHDERKNGLGLLCAPCYAIRGTL